MQRAICILTCVICHLIYQTSCLEINFPKIPLSTCLPANVYHIYLFIFLNNEMSTIKGKIMWSRQENE